MEYETTIGLEIHVQLKTKSKMFCRCNNYAVDAEPNTNICEICMGMPGVLPQTNQEAILWALKTALALNCQINLFTKFDRKHYFYPDLPKGYQISQYEQPLAKNGELEIEIFENNKFYKRKIGISRVHIEEDAGKLLHPENTDYSLVDLNRAGTPLLEIVTEPDIKTPKEARIFAENLRLILRYLEVSNANMEEGNLRIDANISVRRKKERKLGPKVEIKNINSFKMLEQALIYEEERQKEIIEMNKKVVQETRGWNESKGKTISQRTKEEAQDYRYFPEPDIPPLNFKILGWNLEKIKKELPEMPLERTIRFEKEFNLSHYDASILTSEKEMADFFEKVVENLTKQKIEKSKAGKKAASWILVEFLGLLNKEKITFEKSKITPENLAEMLLMIEKQEISGKIAKDIFVDMFKTGNSASEIINKKGIKMIDNKEIEKVIEKVIKENSKAVADYKKGKEASLGFLVGQVMQKTHGQADPKKVNEILKRKL